ncbi:MAG: NosD domain-containing protein, partial [bacterium]
KNQVYEKADNLCYNRSETDTPDWVPTVEEITPSNVSGMAYEANQGAYQVSFAGDLSGAGGVPWSIIYKVKDQTFRLGIKYLGYYDSSNGSSVFLATPNSVVPQLISPNKLVYRNVFPGVDIEYVYTKGAFLQNAIIHSVSSYQSPSHYGLNPASTQLIVATELDLATTANLQVSVDNERYIGDNLAANDYPIDISNAKTGNLLCRFEPNQAFDNAESRKEISVQQRVVSINSHNYLIEGIPYSWLQSASLPVTIDYELWSNTYMGGHELWRSGQTIYVSGLVHVISGSSLVIEGGAVVKFGSNAHLRADAGGQIQVMGNKFDYVIFTSANDETVGEDVTVGTTTAYQTDYNAALEYNSGAQNNSRVNYAKIRYATYGIKYQSSGLTVKDSIFRDCYIAVYCGNTSGVTITNNIISGCMNGIVADSSAQVQVNQNTIDSTLLALDARYNGTIQYYDNIISNCGYAAYSTAGGSFPEAHHNAFWRNDINPDPSVCSSCLFLRDYYSLYAAVPNGQYYLDPNYEGHSNNSVPTNPCFDGGSMIASDAGMTAKTIFPPSVYTTAIHGDYHWQKVNRDTGQVDLGYHYDPVDAVIQPWTEGSCYLDIGDYANPGLIDPGVVVSFYRTLSNNTVRIRVKSNSKLTAIGTGDDPIRFTSVYATSDDIQAPLRGGLDLYDHSGITLRYDADPDSDIQYSEIDYAQYGIRVNGDMNITRPIQNNVFQQNYQGIAFNYSGHAVNNLFTDNKYGIVLGSYGIPTVVVSYLQSNTFYNNNTAVYITNTLSSTTSRKIITRLENNIFTSNYAGTISTTSTNSNIQVETRNNVYWNNQINVAGSSISLNTSTTENRDMINDYCPMLVHKSRVADNQKKYKFLHDGFYLAQRTGDASRIPLRLNDIQSVDISGLSQSPPSPSAGMWFFAYENWGCNWLGIYNSSGYSDYSPTNWGSLLIRFYNDPPEKGEGEEGSPWEIDSGSYLTLTFGQNSSKLDIYLPYLNIQLGGFYWIYVAADGSTYYVRDDHAYADPYQDPYFALQYDIPSITGGTNNGLALSAYDGASARFLAQDLAQSPAVNKGAVRITPASFAGTNAAVTCSNFASLGWTNSEDTVDNNRDSNTTLRWIAETTAANYTDPIGRLDLGYHYKGAVVYPTDIVTTFRYNNRTYAYDTTPEGYGFDYLGGKSLVFRRAISGKYDSSTLNGTNIVVFPASGPIEDDKQYIALGYHIQGTPIVGGMAEYSIDTYWDYYVADDSARLASMWLNNTDVAATSDGSTTFVALYGTKYFHGYTYSTATVDESYQEFVNVYRYNESQYSWSPAVSMEWVYTNSSSTTIHAEKLNGMAIDA